MEGAPGGPGCNRDAVVAAMRAVGVDPDRFMEVPPVRHARNDVFPCDVCGRFWLFKTAHGPVPSDMPVTTKDGFNERYFSHTVEYPEPTHVMMEPGVLLSYVSHTFLAGWINYVKPVSAFLLTRYRAHSKNVEALDAFRKTEVAHTKLCALGDDVLILAREPAETRHGDPVSWHWWFFWFDCDVSDCRVGRFQTKDPPADVVERFADYCRDRSTVLSSQYAGSDMEENSDSMENQAGKPALEIPVDRITGWVGW